ncbi:hypothetical protein [Actinacidiphila guanduensis]|uniref:ATP-binding protein n=1 Tax=Actinacidiphila guanduensis TaxID=310781 RepID=A0A1G9XYN3_9ACTN|nr:hypothetical protein [Actinacidiphila guanduensis]SDN01860.1 hypothetical protein SAMN05216259_102336 [Actinacidiphila guanduensis]
MKYSKVAAVLAGSVMAAGMAAPAFAEDAGTPPVSVDNMSTMPTSINGGVDQALNEQPLQKVADSTHVQSALDTVQSTLQGPVGSALSGAVPGASLLGGLPLGALPLNGLPLNGLG